MKKIDEDLHPNEVNRRGAGGWRQKIDTAHNKEIIM